MRPRLLTTELADGTVAEDGRDTAPGDPDEPLTRGQIEAELRRAARSTKLDADEILAAVRECEFSKLTGLLSFLLVKT